MVNQNFVLFKDADEKKMGDLYHFFVIFSNPLNL